MRSATLIGSSLVVLALVGVEVGCRSNNGVGGTGAGGAGTTTSTKASTGATMTTTTGTTNPTTTTTVTGTTTTGTTTTGSSSSGGCLSTTAPTLHPASAVGATLYCPHGDPATPPPVMNGNLQCNPASQTCCEQTKSMTMPYSTCTANGTACVTGQDMQWGCQDPQYDCNGGTAGGPKVCCTNAMATVQQDPACPAGYLFASKLTSTACQASCTAMELQICERAGDCPTGKTCVPFRKSAVQVGYCM